MTKKWNTSFKWPDNQIKGDGDLADVLEEIEELIEDLKETLSNNVSIWDKQKREKTHNNLNRESLYKDLLTMIWDRNNVELASKKRTLKNIGLINLIVGIISQFIHVSNYHIYILNILPFYLSIIAQ